MVHSVRLVDISLNNPSLANLVKSQRVPRRMTASSDEMAFIPSDDAVIRRDNLVVITELVKETK